MLAQFKISPERQQAIDDWLNFPVWAMLTVPTEYRYGEDPVYRVTRKFCRKVGMSPGEIVRAVKAGRIELIAKNKLPSRTDGPT